MSLIVTRVNFPNETLQPNWYRGQENLRAIEISHCNLKKIKNNAFRFSFQTLYYITIQIPSKLIISPFAFNNLTATSFNLCAGVFANLGKNFLQPIRNSLFRFKLRYLSSRVSLKKFFGDQRLNSIISIEIMGTNAPLNASRVLESTDFSQLPRIQILALRFCSITSIQPGTFDYIGETLALIDLSFNKLTTIESSRFSVFLDTSIKSSKYLLFYYNPIECDCNYYELRNLTLFLRNHYSREGKMPDYFERCDDAKYNASTTCTNLQDISMRKLNNHQPVISKYSFPKVDLRVANGMLSARTQFKAKFRLWIQSYVWIEVRKRTKCPSPQWLRESVTCVLIGGDDKVLPVHQYLQRSNLTTFYVILSVANKYVWPLHIQSVRTNEEAKQLHLVMVLVVVLTLCLGGFAFGLGLANNFWRCAQGRRCEIDEGRRRFGYL